MLAFWLSDGYISSMAKHSVADARNHLSELIDRALKGEDVVITRHGHPVVEIRPLRGAPRRLTPADIEWVAARRQGKTMPAEDAGTLLSRLRDEWTR